MRVLHVFDFWDCVPRILASGVTPLRAYRKTIRFRLKFRLIRSPKTPRKAFQPEPLQKSVLASGWILDCPETLLSGTNRSGGICNPLELIYFFADRFVHVFYSGWSTPLLHFKYGILPFWPKIENLFLSLPFLLLLHFSMVRVWFSSIFITQSLNLLHHLPKFKKEKDWGRLGAQHFIEIKAWLEDFGARAWVGLHCSSSPLQFHKVGWLTSSSWIIIAQFLVLKLLLIKLNYWREHDIFVHEAYVLLLVKSL